MPAKKFYAVKVGREKGIFISWEACKKSVDGFPNAIYKSFSSREQASAYLQGEISNSEIVPNFEENTYDEVIAYIDGSYSDKLKRFSYAAVLFIDGEKTTYSNSENDPDIIELRNVAGELKAAMYAMQFTKKHDKRFLKLYYDYAGIEMWATGQWKANLPYTQTYANYAKKMSEEIHITFIKVKSHSGNLYNDEVDNLAKAALLKDNYSLNNVPDSTQKDDNISVQREKILSTLKGNKTTLNLNFLSKQGLIINSEDVFKLVKSKWKADKRSIKDIKEIKAYYDIESDTFVIGILTNQEKYIYTLRSDEWNG